jgi:Protein kinase domain
MTPDPPRVVGRYEIVRQLGRGGMATVHLARQRALDREVALKELHPAHAADAAFARRFLQESRVAGALNHPSVVSVIEYFEHDGAPFIAMEYLERGSLRPLVGRLTLAHVAGVLDHVLGGLAEAAAQGIVHRDLKPENVLLTADGHAKVADFGIAKALGQLQMTELRTATGAVVGTPAYMAPEQVMGAAVTSATDLYATGMIAYELLAGRHPYDGVDAPMALMLRHANDEPPPLGLVREDLPPGIVAWVHAMLAKDPAVRPASAAHAWDWLEGEVAAELGPRWRRAAALPEPGATWGYVSVVTTAAADKPSTAPTPGAPVASATATSAEPEVPSPAPMPMVAAPEVPSPAPPDPSPRSRRPRALSLLAVMAATLVLAGAAGLSLVSEEEPPPAAAAPAPNGPSLAERVRHDLVPALRANRRVTAELTELVPGSDPDTALVQADAALAATRTALANADVPAARSALRAQISYLRVVRDTLRLDTDHGQRDRLGGLSGRLVSRLERLEPLVPRASASVGGARRLKAWATAELAPPPAAVAPVPVAAAAAPTATPTQTATPRPEATPTATATATATPTPTPVATAPPLRAPILAAPAYRSTSARSLGRLPGHG